MSLSCCFVSVSRARQRWRPPRWRSRTLDAVTAEDPGRLGNIVLGGCPAILQRIRPPELLPFRCTHLMEGQNLDPFNIGQRGHETGEAVDIGWIIRQTRHEHEADPRRLAELVKAPGEPQWRIHRLAGCQQMRLRYPRLDRKST